MQEVKAGRALERFARDHGRGVGAREGQLAGMGLRVGDQLLDRFGRNVRMHQQELREAADPAERREVFHRIEADGLVEARRGRHRRVGAEEDRGAVGR